MSEYHNNWHIAVKPITAISAELKSRLTEMGATVKECDVSLHAHFFIPEDIYYNVQERFKSHGFELTDHHPAFCTFEPDANFEAYQKRVPIIEGREANFLAELMPLGVLMSGGAGKPHFHISIPKDRRSEIVHELSENSYFPM